MVPLIRIERIKAAGGKAKAISKVCGKAAHRASVWFVRGTAIVSGALSTLAIVLFSMLGADGLSLGLVRPALEGAILDQTGARSVSVGGLHLVRDQRGAAPFLLTVTDIEIDQGTGGRIDVPEVALRLTAGNLLRGQTIPKYVEVSGATIAVERRGADVSVGGQTRAGEAIDFGALVASAKEAGFEGALLRDVGLQYTNHSNGARFGAEGGTAALTLDDDGYAFNLSVPRGPGGAEESLSLNLQIHDESGDVDIVLTAVEAPADSLLPIFVGGDESISFAAPVSGEVRAVGNVNSGLATFNLDLSVGEGVATLRGYEVAVEELNLLGSLQPDDGVLTVEDLSYRLSEGSGTVSGAINFIREGTKVSRVAVDLQAVDLVSNGMGLLPEPLPMADGKFAGSFDVDARTLSLDALDADYFGARLRGTMAFAFPIEEGESIGLSADLTIDGEISPRQVLRGWPPALGDGARRWVEANLTDGDLYDVSYTMNIPRGAIAAGDPLPPESLDLVFEAKNATIIYVPGMTPLTGVRATGRIAGNSFILDARGGRAGKVRLLGGEIRMEKLAPKGQPGVFEIKAAGSLTDILALLDEEPLEFISEAGFDPASFEGEGVFDLTIVRPLLSYVPIENYTFDGKGTFRDLSIDLDRFSSPVTDGEGTVTLTNNDLTIGGTVEIEGVPADFSWRRTFGDDAKMSLWAQAALDSGAADAMGLPLRRYIRGEVDTKLQAYGDKSRFREVQLVGDLTNAAITTDDRDFIKRRGEPGDIAALIKLGAEGEPIVFDSLTATMAGANIEGNARFGADGGLLDLDVPRLFIENQADLSARLRRKDDMLVIDLEGDYLYAGGLIDEFFGTQGGEGDEGGLPGGMIIDGALQTVDLKGAVSLKDVVVTGQHDGQEMSSLSLTGQFDDGGTMAINIDENGKGLGHDLTLVTDQFGKALEGAFGISSVSGGDAIFSATLLEEGPLAGTLKAQEVKLQDAPLVARLLSIGSLDGMANVLNGEGIDFDELVTDIQLEDGELRFVNARLTGSALGLSANGNMGLDDGDFDLRGAVAPAYGVNSFLADLPGVGELLVSRKGEGVFAFGYQVSGPVAEPTISVNTLTALTPGILRRLFEPVVGQTPTTDDLLNAAEVSAGLTEARQYLSTPELLREYERLHAIDEEIDGDVR